MLKYLIGRLFRLASTVLGAIFVAFMFIHLLPGDPIIAMAGERNLDPAYYQQLVNRYGFDQPLYAQFLHYLAMLAHGDFGISFISKLPVLTEFLDRFPATVELCFAAIMISSFVGIPLGIVSAYWRGGWIDQLVKALAIGGVSMPIFWWGLLLILLFSVQLGWLPVSGRISLEYFIENRTGFMLIDTLLAKDLGAFGSALAHLVLPAIVLGTVPLAIVVRQTRTALLEALGEDYITTAKAKGLSPVRVLLVHALRNSLITIVTVIGLQLSFFLAGAILTETIFSWPGIAKWLYDGVFRRDYQLVQGAIVLIATMLMMLNLLVDTIYVLINPKLK